MATHTLEEILSHAAACIQRDQNVGNKDVEQAFAMISDEGTPPVRRREVRVDYRCLCSYEALEAIEEESVVIGEGKAFALNRSKEGMLLLTALSPHAKQLIEVHISRSEWGRTVNVYEARWTRPAQVESLGNLYLVGCQRIFGPLHHLLL
ncbi:MAG: hypothetical protein HXY51_08330 [Nitrospirae bacterium]|nr:hypothetical protein [Nitrospirota bacterium]